MMRRFNTFSQQHRPSKPRTLHTLDSKRLIAAKPLKSQSPTSCQASCRLFAVSDTHFDYKENLEWCQRISKDRSYSNDLLILAGDACDSLEILESTLAMLRNSFAMVFYCIGNHELWVRAAERNTGITNSITKLERILDICRRLEISTTPQKVGNLWIAPLHSWHHASFDQEPDIHGVPAANKMTIADYAACRWPVNVPGGADLGSEEMAHWFDGLNEGGVWEEMLASRNECDVVSFSHFLPFQALLPEKRYLFFPNLMKAVGSDVLGQRVERLKPNMHVFGHTHFSWDQTINGVRYIQAPLCSPEERRRRLRTVCFDAAMEQASQDPESASWLPLEIYRFEPPQDALQTLQTRIAQQNTSGTSNNGSTTNNLNSSNTSGICRQLTEVLGPQAVTCPPPQTDTDRSPSPSPSLSRQSRSSSSDQQEQFALLNESMHLPRRKVLILEEERSRPRMDTEGDEGDSDDSDSSDDDDDEGEEGEERNSMGNGSRSSTEYDESVLLSDDPLVLLNGVGSSSSSSSIGINGSGNGSTTATTKKGYVLQHGIGCQDLGAHWSDHYRNHARTPEVTELAPWVASFYASRRKRIRRASS